MAWEQFALKHSRKVLVNLHKDDMLKSILRLSWIRKFHGTPVVRTPQSHCHGPQFDPLSGN